MLGPEDHYRLDSSVPLTDVAGVVVAGYAVNR